MKRIIITISVAFSALAMHSCSFLDLDPKVIDPGTFYQKQSDVMSGLAGVYGAINNEAFYGNYYSLMMSSVDDLCYYNREVTAGAPYFFNYGTTDSQVYGAWTSMYAGVKNANEFMEAMERVREKLDPDMRYYSEARFLRAYYHFLLAQAWGDVPLRTVAVKSPSSVQLAATPQADVLTWCVEEMEDCIDYLPEGMEGAPSRVTRSAVQGILARVYLFMAGATVKGMDSQAMYTKAAYWANEVITSGLHQLNPDYKQVFVNMISDKYDKTYYESIWEADFLGDRQEYWTNGRIGDLMGMQNTATDNKYDEWKCNYSYGMYNASLKLWDLYWTDDRTDDEYQIASRIIDLRQDWNLAAYNYSGNANYNATAGYDKTPFVYDSKSSLEYPTAAQGQRNASKWRREVVYEGQHTAKNLYTGINYPILRYSDVLLMYAEAINEISGANAAEAYDYVKEVRDRAGIKTRDAGDYASQNDMRQLVRNERGRELCFEALRKYDLIRWGIFVQEMKRYSIWKNDERWSKNAMSTRAAVLGTNVQEKHIYQPVPSIELGVNKLLRQNPMW